MSKVFPENVVKSMLLDAYKSGFDGPLELMEEVCQELMEKNYKDSDLSVIDAFPEMDSTMPQKAKKRIFKRAEITL